jgi:hypothetical protein
LMATKSPFSRSSPLYTRPYAPFPISSPSICTHAGPGTVSESKITPKFAATEHEFPPDLSREARESLRICCRASWICGTAHCAASTPYRRLLLHRAPGAAWRGGGGRISSHRRRCRVSRELVARAIQPCSRVWVGKGIGDGGEQEDEGRRRETEERDGHTGEGGFSVILTNFRPRFDIFLGVGN